MAKDLNIKKLASIVSLPVIAIAMIALNSSFKVEDQKQQDRGIASLSKSAEGGATDWEQTLAAALAQGRERIPASTRSRPTVVQELAFGPLEGKYSLSYSEGRVTDIVFTDSSIGTDRPKYIDSPETFLTKYKEAWAADFSEVRIISTEKLGQSVVHNLELLDEASNVTGSATLITDEPGRLLRLKILKL